MELNDINTKQKLVALLGIFHWEREIVYLFLIDK